MIGMVYLSWSVSRTSGVKRLFQLDTKLKIACVAIAGFIIGRTMELNIKYSPAPSILADCTISIDKVDCKYCLIKNTIDGEAIAGKINMSRLFVIWIL